MTSQKAKEYEALALSLALVNNDLRQKNFYRKSEFYQQSDELKKKLQAQILAAENLSRELREKTPQLSIMLNNAINNQPIDLLNINRIPIQQVNQLPPLIEEVQRQTPSEQELQAARLRPIPTQKVNIRDLIREQIEKLRPVEETKEQTKQETKQEKLQKDIEKTKEEIKSRSSELSAVDRGVSISDEAVERQLTLDYIQSNGRTYPFFNANTIRAMDEFQLDRASKLLLKILEDGIESKVLNQNQKSKIRKAVDALERQQNILINNQRPTKPKIRRTPTPPVGPRPPTQSPRKDTGSVATAEPPSVIITRDDVATSQQVGMGMDYKKILPKKPTKDMKKLILLIGSQRAGNNSEKLKKDIDVVFNRIKKDLTDKLNKAKK